MHQPRRPALAVAVFLVAVLLVLSGCATRTSAPPAGAVSAADAASIDDLFEPYARPGAPGAAVVVIADGRPAFMRAYGLADLEANTPVTEATNFRLASLTKAFTAMAILLLVNDGRLRLDDHVRTILPDFPMYGREIRIRHLLSHTSGLRAYRDLVRDPPGRQIRDRDVLALLHRTRTTEFPPGAAFRYGDSGYAVLALVVETLSGVPFARFLHDRILAPIGMQSTIAYEPGGPAVTNRALGYAVTPAGVRPADQSNTSTVLGDGGIYSSVHDLVAWDRALDSRALVDPHLHELAWTPATLNDGTRSQYGFGWFIDRDAAGLQLSHRGETSGFTNFIAKFPDRRLTVVVLTNRQGGAPWSIAAAVAALASFRTAL